MTAPVRWAYAVPCGGGWCHVHAACAGPARARRGTGAVPLTLDQALRTPRAGDEPCERCGLALRERGPWRRPAAPRTWRMHALEGIAMTRRGGRDHVAMCAAYLASNPAPPLP